MYFFFVCHNSVIATMRDLKKKDKLEEAAGDAYRKTLTLLPLDVCSDESVKQCVNSIKDRHIDILSELLLFFLWFWVLLIASNNLKETYFLFPVQTVFKTNRVIYL